jgi:hypothetical protein
MGSLRGYISDKPQAINLGSIDNFMNTKKSPARQPIVCETLPWKATISYAGALASNAT